MLPSQFEKEENLETFYEIMKTNSENCWNVSCSSEADRILQKIEGQL